MFHPRWQVRNLSALFPFSLNLPNIIECRTFERVHTCASIRVWIITQSCVKRWTVKISPKRNCYSSLTQSKGINQSKYDFKIHCVIRGNNNQLWQIICTFRITMHCHFSCFVERELRSYLHRTSEIWYFTWLIWCM